MQSGGARRDPLLALAAAAYGLGCAIALATLTIGPPHAGQLPGAMLLRGLDARIPMRMMLLAIAGPVVAALALAPLLRRFDGATRWARVAAALSLASGLWSAVVDPSSVVGAIVIPLLLAAAVFLARSVDLRFTRRDVILIPAGITLLAGLAALPLAIAVPLSAAAIMVLRIAVAAMKPRVDPAYTFVLAPAVLLLHVHAWFNDVFIALASPIAIFSPLILARMLRRPPRRLLVCVIYPLFALALMASTSLLSAERAPRLDLFEDGHWLTPANELTHGATAYADIVPGHGFLNDGLLEAAVMRLGAKDAGQLLFVRHSLATLLAPALYVVAFALTGSAEAAILTILAAAAMLLTGTSIPGAVSVLESNAPIRTLPPMFALACCLAAVRRRNPRPLVAAGALAVLSVLTSVDFGFYAFVILAMTLIRFGPGRLRAIAYAGGGAAALTVVAAVAMAIHGCLVAFVRVTLFEIPKLTEPYALQFFYWPPQHEGLLGVPDLLAGLFLPRTVSIVAWCMIALGTAAALAVTRAPSRAADPMIVAGTWVILGAISFGERAHVIFMPVAMAVAVAGIYALRRNRTLFAIATVTLILACAPTQMLLRTQARLQAHGPLDPILTRYDALPRAHGVWLDRRNAQRLALVQSAVDHTLGPNDTFFDFANMPGLYYVLDRRCPVRMYEVPFYETEALQREVIAALERNPRVRLAVMQFTNRDDVWIDEVPNPVRAPLVFAWLREHFQPFLTGDGVQVWIRR